MPKSYLVFRTERRGGEINKNMEVSKLILSASTFTFKIIEAYIVIKYCTYTHIPVPDLDRAILTASCNKFPISAVCASCRNHSFTLNGSWLKYAFVLFFIVNIPSPHSSEKIVEINSCFKYVNIYIK